MGANFFEEYEKILPDDEKGSSQDTLDSVFSRAVEAAAYEYGHRGYTGSLAEKGEVTFIGTVKTKREAREAIDKLVEASDERIDDKWGPAGAILIEEEKTYVFFGWAAS